MSRNRPKAHRADPRADSHRRRRDHRRRGRRALTIRRLGQPLDRDPTAIYRHAADKDALLDGVIEHVAAELVTRREPDSNGTGIGKRSCTTPRTRFAGSPWPCGCRKLGHVTRPARTRVRGRGADLVAVAERTLGRAGECGPRAGVDGAIGAGGACCSARRTWSARSIKSGRDVGCVGAARLPRDGAPGSRRPSSRRTGRAASASSARGQPPGTRVEGPRRAILLGGLRAVTARPGWRRRH